MKTDKIPYIIFFLVNSAVALSCYFYPVTRDEFYYLDRETFVNPFSEYYSSYFYGNPRIGQFFSNLVSRNIILEIAFGLILFYGFFSAIFLNIYRRLPNFKNAEDISRFLICAAFFIFLINYFGEMFYYTPFSGNYTFTHIFYLFFVFLFTEYYVFNKEKFLNTINYFVLFLFGIFVGMCNEHVPPVLLAMSFFGAIYYLVKNNKLPNLRFIVLPIAIFVGYLILFFAPANSIKEKTVGKSVFDVGISSYASNFAKVIKLFYYYNFELVVTAVFVVVLALIFRKKIFQKNRILVVEILVYLAFAVLSLFIVAVSPLTGTRLLFFSSSLMIVVLILILKRLYFSNNFRKVAAVMSYLFLLVFFSASVFITYYAHKNYESVISEIEKQRKKSDDIVLQKSFDYFTPNLKEINRKILMEDGTLYIDRDASSDNSTERNIKTYYQLRSLKIK